MTTIVLSAGGTGGHLFPAQALAAELMRRGRSIVVMTDARGTQYPTHFPGARDRNRAVGRLFRSLGAARLIAPFEIIGGHRRRAWQSCAPQARRRGRASAAIRACR